MRIPNYEIVNRIAESNQAIIYKAYHNRNPRQPLTLKVLKPVFLHNYKISQIYQRIEHLKILNSPLVITPIEFNVINDLYYITQNYFEGEPLSHLVREHAKIPLLNFFTIARKLAEALNSIHRAGIIHGGIKPHNVLIDPETLDIRIIDFISAIDVRDVSHFIYDRSFIENTLAYTSPEQTGRINHRVTFATDLYSLGVILYEMLTNCLPFSTYDPLELIHAHLAKEPVGVHELYPDIPMVLSNIVAKLLLKAPEKRYHSSEGLFSDLKRCSDEYNATGEIKEFPLEKSVSPHRITFISKMVGRDKETKIILNEFAQVAEGKFRSLFISGLSGIGKTRLIQELQKPIVEHKGYFTSGKFDVYQKNIPYSSLIQAFRNLMRTFLTESDDKVAVWKRKIINAVGKNGKVLTDVIPELEVLIGPQPEVKQLPPVESLNRFHDLFNRFLTCLASEENPLTLFIDDLQWCDTASFDFLTNIFANYQDHRYLFLLGAYRHNEVDASHPLAKLIRNAGENGQPLKEIRLEPLEPEHRHEMVSYILDSTLAETKTLSDFISTLSEGNPLFVSESLSYLHHENLLFFDDDRQWRWDLDKIRQSRMPTTVVALFSAKIRKLSPDLIEMLEYCACLGNTFSPAELSAIRGFTLRETFAILKPALEQGLLMENKGRLQFIHDRVQEAVLSAIPAEKRRSIHWQVGSHLLAAAPKSHGDLEKLDNLFTIVSHLNLGREDNPDAETAYLLSDMNYYAGNKALDSLATEAANEYYNLSRVLLPDDCWEEAHYERTFRIFQKAAKTELMCGNYERSEKLLDYLLDHAKTDLDKAECLAEQTTSLSSIGNFIKAIETANRGLAYFGKAIPADPEEADKRRRELMAEIDAMGIDVWETILNMPFTTDRKSAIELAFYSELIPDLYMSGLVPQLYLSAAQSTRHCLARGMDESVIYSFSIMGLQLGEEGDFARAFKYEDLARDLSAKYPNTFGATRGMNGIVWCNMHSRSHPREIVAYCRKSIQSGKNCGDLYNAGLSYGPLMWNLQVMGTDMSAIEEYARECLQFSHRYHLSFSVGLAEAMLASWVEPMKKEYTPVPMDEKIAQWERDNHIASVGSYYVHMALTHYYFGEYKTAQDYLLLAKKYLSGLTDNVLKRQWHIFLCLNTLKLYEMTTRKKTKTKILQEILPLIDKIKTWAELGPLLGPYLAFLSAELKRVTGDFNAAMGLYLEAIDRAHAQNYVFLEGYLHECLGEQLHRPGRSSARIFLKEAAQLYRNCRAERKELDLIGKYPEFFAGKKASFPQQEITTASLSTLPDLDIEYLMRSALAISAEIEQDALLERIMNIVIESSGAQHGYLLIADESGLFIRAESHVSDQSIIKTLDRKLEEANDICKAIVRYVFRTGERLILNNASEDGVFKDNLEVQYLGLRSVLCIPVVKQSHTIGVLYLENRLADSVFTDQRIQITELLTFQAAISLDNAILFTKQKQTEQALRDREYELRLIMDTMPALISYVDSDCRYCRVNKSYERWIGKATDEIRGRRVCDVLGEASWQAVRPYMERALAGEQVTYQRELFFNEIGARWVETTYSPDRDAAGHIRGFVEHSVDIGKMKEAEEKVKESLREKEVLLTEIHHRVKNNLQIVHSILNLQLSYIKDEQSIELFKESRNRVYSMALIHEKLYQSESLSRIDLPGYIQDLITNLFYSYGASDMLIKPLINVENITLNIDTVIPCALIINELVSNSLGHAFKDHRFSSDFKGQIVISICHGIEGKYILTVCDNGHGMPPNFNLQACESLGLKLVSVLVRQLNGTISLNTDGKTEFTITFAEKRRDRRMVNAI
ncbi:MAG: AAA family ATPase [Patescibacteria group bacterium]